MSKPYEIMENMAFMLKSEALYLRLKELIDEKTSEVIKPHDRGIGKSYNLMRLSQEYNIPLIVGSSKQKYILLNNNRKLSPIIITQDEIYGFKIETDIVLIDEYRLIRQDVIQNLKDKKLKIIATDSQY